MDKFLAVGVGIILFIGVKANSPPCQGLPASSATNGMQIVCNFPKDNSSVDCTTPVDRGTIAQYSCKGKNGTLKCVCKGRWRGVPKFNELAIECGATPLDLSLGFALTTTALPESGPMTAEEENPASSDHRYSTDGKSSTPGSLQNGSGSREPGPVHVFLEDRINSTSSSFPYVNNNGTDNADGNISATEVTLTSTLSSSSEVGLSSSSSSSPDMTSDNGSSTTPSSSGNDNGSSTPASDAISSSDSSSSTPVPADLSRSSDESSSTSAGSLTTEQSQARESADLSQENGNEANASLPALPQGEVSFTTLESDKESAGLTSQVSTMSSSTPLANEDSSSSPSSPESESSSSTESALTTPSSSSEDSSASSSTPTNAMESSSQEGQSSQEGSSTTASSNTIVPILNVNNFASSSPTDGTQTTVNIPSTESSTVSPSNIRLDEVQSTVDLRNETTTPSSFFSSALTTLNPMSSTDSSVSIVDNNASNQSNNSASQDLSATSTSSPETDNSASSTDSALTTTTPSDSSSSGAPDSESSSTSPTTSNMPQTSSSSSTEESNQNSQSQTAPTTTGPILEGNNNRQSKAFDLQEPTDNNEAFEDFQIRLLNLHNQLRLEHKAQPMQLNSTLNKIAQDWADKSVNAKELETTPGKRKYAQNLFRIGSSIPVNSSTAIGSAFRSWSKGSKSFNYENPKPSAFSQMIWNETSQLGVGIASNGTKVAVVATYYPRGNVVLVDKDGTEPISDPNYYFKANVFPPDEHLTTTQSTQ